MTNLNIDRLTLKLSGLSQNEGQRLAQMIATRLASSEIPGNSVRDTPSLQMNINIPPNKNVDSLANEIVSEILRQLN